MHAPLGGSAVVSLAGAPGQRNRATRLRGPNTMQCFDAGGDEREARKRVLAARAAAGKLGGAEGQRRRRRCCAIAAGTRVWCGGAPKGRVGRTPSRVGAAGRLRGCAAAA